MFRLIAEKSGPSLNYGTFKAAGESLGEVAIPGGAAKYTYGPYPSRDGDHPMALWKWDRAQERFIVEEAR